MSWGLCPSPPSCPQTRSIAKGFLLLQSRDGPLEHRIGQLGRLSEPERTVDRLGVVHVFHGVVGHNWSHDEGAAIPWALVIAHLRHHVIRALVGLAARVAWHNGLYLLAQPRVGQHVVHLHALTRVDGKHPVEQLHDGRREVRAAALVPGVHTLGCRSPLGLLLHQLAVAPVVLRRLIEWEEAREHCKEADAQAPDVSEEAIVPGATEHLGRRVRLAAAHLLERYRAVKIAVVPLGIDVRETKVNHLDHPVLGEEHVLQLEVPMRHAARVAVVNTG
mmetsp:Transcript_3802/g.7380  ORF Transcript_3802/g.7380 Transcript_3802/m.7380 type:complete len:276 (+) Transcript_3802:121-948(+)